MSVLPSRPDPDQLRRQARELSRAAASGEPAALGRLRAVSGPVTLSGAQLAIAREHGFASWPALLRAARRLRAISGEAPEKPAGRPGGPPAPGLRPARWSFGGAGPIPTATGLLSPGALVAGPDRAALDGVLAVPGRETGQDPARPGPVRQPEGPALGAAVAADRPAQFGGLTVTDSTGTGYRMTVTGWMSAEPGPHWFTADVDPVPQPGCGWLELRNRAGDSARLARSARTVPRVRQLPPAAASPAEREIAGWADYVLGGYLRDLAGPGAAEPGMQAAGDEQGSRSAAMRPYCSYALAGLDRLRRAGAVDPASPLPGQLTRLCAVLSEAGGPAAGGLLEGLAPGWARLLGGAGRSDGRQLHLDIGAALPVACDTVVQVDTLVSESGGWRVFLRAWPEWWLRSEDGQVKWDVYSTHAEDDRGGRYLAGFGGSATSGACEELVLRFAPRLDPLAARLTLVFGTGEQDIAVEIGLPADSSGPAGPE